MNRILIRNSGICDYQSTCRAMMQFTQERNAGTMDEIWYLQHPPVYTLGMAGRDKHILKNTGIPVIKTDRGGQVTYHGPGQLVVYLLIDLLRKKFTVKRFVSLLEQSLIDMCETLSITAERRAGAPGVYVNGRKIAALGIRVKRGCSYHGLALNVNMDLAPFSNINPCGYPGLEVTQLSDFSCRMNTKHAFNLLLPILLRHLDYDHFENTDINSDQVKFKDIQAA